MPIAQNGDVELYYETVGDPDDVPLLLIMGLGAQLIEWDRELCEAFADRGFFVVLHDNRNVGLSSYFDDDVIDLPAVTAQWLSGEPLSPPYTIEDMADDAAAVLGHAGIGSAHIMGASMGGMIAQAFAIRHRGLTRSLVSIMSTTGDPDVGQIHPEALAALITEPGTTRDQIIEQGIEATRVISSPVHFDAERVRTKVEAAYDRANHPEGRVRQLLAIIAAASRTDDLRALEIPAVVIHGELDPLVDPSGGVRTHEALRGSELVLLPDAAHDLPEIYWPNLIEKITALAASADAAATAHASTSR